jgi:hypothetical protein
MAYSFTSTGTNDFSAIGYLRQYAMLITSPVARGTGENSNHWFAECIALMEANDIGWAWWPHKRSSPSPDLCRRADPGYDHFSATGERCPVRLEGYAVAALNAQAEN